MAYEPSTWADGEAGGTPITAAALNKIEQGIGGSAEASHTHAAGDIASGTLSTARIPSLAISKITGLQDALDALSARLDTLEGGGAA